MRRSPSWGRYWDCCPEYGGKKLATAVSVAAESPAAFCAMLLATGILISTSTFGDHLAGADADCDDGRLRHRLHGSVHLSGIGNGSVQRWSVDLRGAQPFAAQISEASAAVVAGRCQAA